MADPTPAGTPDRQEVARLRAALSEIEQLATHPADLAPDLIGHPDRYRLLADRLAEMARAALREPAPVTIPTGVFTRPGVPTPLPLMSGRFDWKTRGERPGLDQGAVEALARSRGYHPFPGATGHSPGKWAGGLLAEFMSAAFASSFDRLGAHLGGFGEWTAAHGREVLGLLAFGWAGCRAAEQTRELIRGRVLPALRSAGGYQSVVEALEQFLAEEE